MINSQETYKHTNQGVAAYVDYLNRIRLSELMSNINSILEAETDNLADLDNRTFKALSHIERSASNIEKLIDSKRGGPFGVNGFIAEFAEEGVSNAKSAYRGMKSTVSVINNNGPADLIIGSKGIQMKFYDDPLLGLKQASQYDDLIMMYPNNHVNLFDRIMRGETDVSFNDKKLTTKQIDTIKSLIEEESARRNEPYNKWMQASALDYDDVQKDNITETLTREQESILRKSEDEQTRISNETKEQQSSSQQKASSNLAEAHKVAAVGAIVQGSMNLAVYVYSKHKEGKEIWEFESKDWKDAGIKVGEGTLKGGVTGYSIYGLTNVCHLSAPSAGAITSGTYGLFRAVIQFRNARIDDDEFIDLLVLNATDSTGSAIGAAIGQAVIPVPVIGAVIGSITFSTIQGLGKNVLNKKEMQLINDHQVRLNNYIDKLDETDKELYKLQINKYKKLGELQEFSFNINQNIELKLNGSIELAQKVGVDEKRILHSKVEIDDYFLT